MFHISTVIRSRRLLLMSATIACLAQYVAAADPLVSTDITVAGGKKTYAYLVSNPQGSGYAITSFELYMPRAGLDAVIDVTCSDLGYDASLDLTPYPGWIVSDIYVGEGDDVTFWLTTAADVPTAYDYEIPVSGRHTNWGFTTIFDGHLANSILAVPVPEPCSLLALACGLAGLGGIMRHRRCRG